MTDDRFVLLERQTSSLQKDGFEKTFRARPLYAGNVDVSYNPFIAPVDDLLNRSTFMPLPTV